MVQVKCLSTESFLRSKELQRIHKPCVLLHKDTSKCILVYIHSDVSRESQKVKPQSSKKGLP